MRSILLYATLALTLLISACDRDWRPSPHKPTPCDPCGVTATVRAIPICGTPPLPDPLPVYFELENGEALNVCNMDVLAGKNLRHDDVVKICYEACDANPTAGIAAGGCIPNGDGRYVKITCVSVIKRARQEEPNACPMMMKERNPGGYPVWVEHAWTEGHNLKLAVAYSGCGKRSGDFQLYWPGDVMESYPAQTSLLLRDLLTNGTCAMVVYDTLCFDVRALDDAGEDQLILRLNDRDFAHQPDRETPLRVLYTKP